MGDEVIYKGRELLKVFDIDRNVPKDLNHLLFTLNLEIWSKERIHHI